MFNSFLETKYTPSNVEDQFDILFFDDNIDKKNKKEKKDKRKNTVETSGKDDPGFQTHYINIQNLVRGKPGFKESNLIDVIQDKFPLFSKQADQIPIVLVENSMTQYVNYKYQVMPQAFNYEYAREMMQINCFKPQPI